MKLCKKLLLMGLLAFVGSASAAGAGEAGGGSSAGAGSEEVLTLDELRAGLVAVHALSDRISTFTREFMDMPHRRRVVVAKLLQQIDSLCSGLRQDELENVEERFEIRIGQLRTAGDIPSEIVRDVLPHVLRFMEVLSIFSKPCTQMVADSRIGMVKENFYDASNGVFLDVLRDDEGLLSAVFYEKLLSKFSEELKGDADCFAASMRCVLMLDVETGLLKVNRELSPEEMRALTDITNRQISMHNGVPKSRNPYIMDYIDFLASQELLPADREAVDRMVRLVSNLVSSEVKKRLAA